MNGQGLIQCKGELYNMLFWKNECELVCKKDKNLYLFIWTKTNYAVIQMSSVKDFNRTVKQAIKLKCYLIWNISGNFYAYAWVITEHDKKRFEILADFSI